METMVFEISENNIEKVSADVIVIFAFQDKKKFVLTEEGTSLDSHLSGLVSKALEFDQFKGAVGDTSEVQLAQNSLARKVVVLGLGKKDEFTQKELRRALALFTKKISKKYSAFVVEKITGTDSGLDVSQVAFVMAEGILLAKYEFAKYKKEDEKGKELEAAIFLTDKENLEAVKKAVERAELFVKATDLARDLVNEQAAVATPTYLADVAKDIAKSSPQISLKIIDKAEAEKMGMNAFLGIARASDTPPKFIYLSYKPKTSKSKKKLAILGKGITFDSGGINVKPGDHMQTMKQDMAGAAVVLGVFSVIARIQPDFEVMGVIAATPNLISGSSIVPGDVVKAYNGKTIEVLNTDAEGRVTMADSLSFAAKEKATEIVDLATLTGAVMVALGTDIAGLMGNDEDLAKRIKASAHDAGEEVWELPLPKEYKKLNKSDVADIANIPSTRWGGTITAGLFLQEFVDNIPWVHLDIAGPAFYEGPYDFGPKGASGFGVRTLLTYLMKK